MRNKSLYGNYRARKFSQIWETVGAFIADWNESQIPKLIADETAKTLYYLLYARYGNSTVASSDETQFKYKVYSTIFMYGPTWEKRLEIQQAVRELDLDSLMDGGKAVYNQALNPGQAVAGGQGAPVGEGTNTLDELTYINQQNTTRYKKSKVDAYSILTNLLETDVTEEFIGRFKKLFLTVVQPEVPLWYVTDLNTDEEDDE